MLVSNMRSLKGNAVPNQYVINDGGDVIFQSYNSTIAIISGDNVILGCDWDYSRTTMKYLKMFLESTIGGYWNKSEILKAIENGLFTYNPSLK